MQTIIIIMIIINVDTLRFRRTLNDGWFIRNFKNENENLIDNIFIKIPNGKNNVKEKQKYI